MANDDIRKLQQIVKKEILNALKPVNAKLDMHTKKLDSHTASLMGIEHTLEGYAAMYKVNKEDNEKIKGRVSTIEEHLGIATQE